MHYPISRAFVHLIRISRRNYYIIYPGYLHTCQMDEDNIPKPSKLTDIDPQAVSKEPDPDALMCGNNTALEKGINFSQVLQDA